MYSSSMLCRHFKGTPSLLAAGVRFLAEIKMIWNVPEQGYVTSAISSPVHTLKLRLLFPYFQHAHITHSSSVCSFCFKVTCVRSNARGLLDAAKSSTAFVDDLFTSSCLGFAELFNSNNRFRSRVKSSLLSVQR